jgi:predicted lipid-binding transport protein (Tim44 family)
MSGLLLAESTDNERALPDSLPTEITEANPLPMNAPSPVRPFLFGTLVGGLAGAALGTLLSHHTRGFFVGLYQLLSRRLSSSERDQLRFELLLQ